MKQALSPILFFLVLHAAGQRAPTLPSVSFSLSNTTLSPQKVNAGSGKTFAISGGEFKFAAKDRISLHAVSIRTLDADLNKIQKSSMAVAGISILLFKLKGLSVKAFVSQGFNMRQAILYYPRKESVTFEGLAPIFSTGIGAEYKINKHVHLFSRLRWIGGDVTNQGNQDFTYGQFVFHTGISCKITAAKKKWG